MTAQFNYKDTLSRAEQVTWRVEDLIGGDKMLDFSKPFLPESLARVGGMTFLTEEEKVVLNQIRGHGYLYMFGVVEEFVLPFVMNHAEAQLSEGDDYKIRALLQFASEEAKHIHLFKKFREEFIDGFGCECEVIGPAEAIGDEVLRHDPLAVSFAILAIEWMTQQHFTESVRDNASLDLQFKGLLKHHWMEEMQHAQLDTLMTEAIAETQTPEQRINAASEYLEIGAFIDGGLKQQTQFDMEAFERKTGRTLTVEEQEIFMTTQHQAMRWTFLGSGLIHPRVTATFSQVTPTGARAIAEAAPMFC